MVFHGRHWIALDCSDSHVHHYDCLNPIYSVAKTSHGFIAHSVYVDINRTVRTLINLFFYQFFMQAKVICPSDPLVYNELGVVAYNMKE